MTVVIGALTADLSANSAAFANDLRKARTALRSDSAKMNRALASMDRSWTRLSGTVLRSVKSFLSFNAILGAVAGTAGLGLLVRRSLDVADSIGKVADKVGVTTAELQELRFAAEQSGVAQSALDMAIQRFSRRVGEARQGTGELKDTLKQYGIQLTDSAGRSRSIVEILKDLADEARDAGDSQEQLRIAFKAFDSEGAALVNLLRKGREGIERFQHQARDAGLVIEDDLIRKAETAKDQFNLLASSLSANLTRAVLSLAPELTRLGKAAEKALPAIARFVDRFLPDDTAGVEELQRRLDEATQSLLRFDKTMAPILNQPQREQRSGLEQEIELLQRLIEERKRSDEAVRTGIALAGAADDTDDKRAEKIKSVIEALTFEREQMDRTAVGQRVMNELRRAGVKVTDEEAQGIRELATEIVIEKQRREELEEARKKAAEKAKKDAEELKKKEEEAAKASEQLGRQLVSATLQGARGAENLSDALEGLLSRITEIIFELLVLKPLEESLSGAIGGAGGFLSDLFGSAASGAAAGAGGGASAPVIAGRAEGGPLAGGQPAVVGEEGPELFVPGRSGTVIPNDAMGGGITIFADMRGASADAVRRLERLVADVDGSIEPRAVAAMAAVTTRRGTSRGVFGA